jgi:hypothetical protein
VLPRSAPGTFFQLGYVTADIAAAKEVFRQQYGVTGYLEFDTAASAPPGSFGIKVALGYSRGVMVELIEPDPRSPGIYGDAVDSARPATLHHLGFLIDQQAFDAHEIELAASGVPVPVVNRSGGMCLLYADTRAGDGLFTELVVPTQTTRDLFAGIPGGTLVTAFSEVMR